MSTTEKKSKNFFQKKSTYIVIGLVVLASIIIIPIIRRASQPQTTQNYYTVYKTDLQKLVKDTSGLEPLDIRKVSGQNGSKVTEILVGIGEEVSAGQVVAKLDLNGKTTEVKSPIKGNLVKLNYKVEETIAQSELFQVADYSNFIVNANVSSSEINNIKIGQTAKLKINNIDSEKDFNGKVTNIQNFSSIDNAGEFSSNYRVKVQLDEKPAGTISGMKARVTIYADKQDNALVVENTRLFQKADGSSYGKRVDWINKDQNLYTLREVTVTTGLETDTYTQILSGLNDGDQLASSKDTLRTNTGPSFLPPR
jgi:multidrug efflux pump subunit AcrA (membrane-fusion protein)